MLVFKQMYEFFFLLWVACPVIALILGSPLFHDYLTVKGYKAARTFLMVVVVILSFAHFSAHGGYTVANFADKYIDGYEVEFADDGYPIFEPRPKEGSDWDWHWGRDSYSRFTRTVHSILLLLITALIVILPYLTWKFISKPIEFL